MAGIEDVFAVVFISFGLPRTGSRIQSWKGTVFFQQLYAFVQAGRQIEGFDGYGSQLPIVDSKSERSVFLKAKTIGVPYFAVADTMMSSFSILSISFAANCQTFGPAR